MPHEALRAIRPIARWSEKQAAAVKFSSAADPILPTPFRIGAAAAATVAATGLAASELWETRTGAAAGGVGGCSSGHSIAAQWALHEAWRQRAFLGAKQHHGALSHARWALELFALQFPEPSSCCAWRARRGGGSRCRRAGGCHLESGRPRGGHHRRKGRRRHGTHPVRMGEAPSIGIHRGIAIDGNRAYRRTARPSCCQLEIGRFRASACLISRGCLPGPLAPARSPSTAPTC